MDALHRVLFLLSGNISTTPRAKKVLEYLEHKGICVDLVMFSRGENWKHLDKDYLSRHNVSWVYLPFSRKDDYIIWVLSTGLHKQHIASHSFIKSKFDIFLETQCAESA